MSEEKQLAGREAVMQLKEIVDHQHACLMVTMPKNEHPHCRPMAVAEVDAQGNFWFVILQDSDKCADLLADNSVHLYFTNPRAQEYLSVQGHGEVVDDRARVQRLWNPIAKAWVPEGSDNEDLRMLKVVPNECHYWDTQDGAVVAAIKILGAAVGIGSKDGGVEGKLTV